MIITDEGITILILSWQVYSGSVISEVGNVIWLNDTLLANRLSPSDVTVFGTLILFSVRQSQNTSFSILLTDDGISTLFSDTHQWNAASQIILKDDGC